MLQRRRGRVEWSDSKAAAALSVPLKFRYSEDRYAREAPLQESSVLGLLFLDNSAGLLSQFASQEFSAYRPPGSVDMAVRNTDFSCFGRRRLHRKI
jgi:hypothetical protein